MVPTPGPATALGLPLGAAPGALPPVPATHPTLPAPTRRRTRCGRGRSIRGLSEGAPRAVLTKTIVGVDFLKLISGGLDPMRGRLGGKIHLAGDALFAATHGSMPRVRPPRLA